MQRIVRWMKLPNAYNKKKAKPEKKKIWECSQLRVKIELKIKMLMLSRCIPSMPNSARARTRDNWTHFQGHIHVIHLCKLREYAIRTYFFLLHCFIFGRLTIYIYKNTYGRSRSCTIREGAVDIEVRKWRNWIGSIREKKAEEHRPSRTCINRHCERPMAHLRFSQSLFSGHIRGRGVLNSKCAPHYYYCSFFFIFPFLPQLFSVFFQRSQKNQRRKKNYIKTLLGEF